MSKKKKWSDKYKINSHYQMIQGGNANVYQVVRESDGKIFALKEQRNLDGEKKLRFKREVKIVLENQNDNDGILKIIDCSDNDENGYWYVTPWSTSLMEALKNKKIEDIVSAIIEIGRTLECLHAKDISHRDIKPDNIFYSDEHYVLGDFGLVHYPGCICCTQTESHLGAWSTMAPEMRRNPKTADGKKADVYSLAKTLWILITGNKLGFDGEYTLESPIVLKVDKEVFSSDPYSIVDIHELLLDSTKNIPDLRPDMKTFCDRLQTWLDEIILESPVKWQLSQQKEWHFIEKLLFIKPPQRAFWEDKEEIVNILNLIAKTDQLSHFLIDFGGDDLQKAELSTREGEILINNILIKPQKLIMERIEKDSMWNYFILEIQKDEKEQEIYNKYALLPNGELVESDGINYGLYDYDSGKKLPKGYKIVYKYYKGNIIFIPKSGPYNHIRSTYDGRHFDANLDVFREYIKILHYYFIKFYNKTISVEEFLNNNDIFTKNPFKKEVNKLEKINEQNKLPSVTNEYLMENYKNWDFSEHTNTAQTNPIGMIKYFIYFHAPDDVSLLIKKRLSHECLILCKDGFIMECSYLDNENSNILYFSNVDEAEEVCEKCRNSLKNIVEGDGYSLIYNHLSVNMIRNFNKTPDYEFTVEDIRNTIYNADDRLDNYLIINKFGYPEMVRPSIHDSLYPVRGPYWGANGRCTGKYSNYTDKEIEKIYNDFKKGWLRYLENGTAQFV